MHAIDLNWELTNEYELAAEAQAKGLPVLMTDECYEAIEENPQAFDELVARYKYAQAMEALHRGE